MHRHAIQGVAAAAFLGTAAAAQTPPASPPKVEAQQDDFTKALDLQLANTPQKEGTSNLPSFPLPGGGQLKLTDLSLDVLASFGASTERNDELLNLELGDHDPNRRGFRLNQAEVSIGGAVDPYFTAESHFVYKIDSPTGETGVELEEAFFTTSSLPYHLQLKGGMFLTEFGRINSTHPHAWDFVDQPVIMGRIFGGDGMRAPGARLSWLAPTPWYAEFLVGMQNADGEQMTSFLGNDETTLPGGHVTNNPDTVTSGDFMYNARLLQSWDFGDDVVTQLGVSGAFGPNAMGNGNRTSIWGGDLRVKWQPPRNDDGWPFLIWQTEYLHRNYSTDLQQVDPDGVPASGDEYTAPGGMLKDDGYYTYLLWGFERDWIGGVRFERAVSSGPTATPSDQDPLRDDRTRVSPILMWQPTHFSRVSLQYNFDVADHLSQDASSIWLRIEFLIGSHPAHKY